MKEIEPQPELRFVAALDTFERANVYARTRIKQNINTKKKEKKMGNINNHINILICCCCYCYCYCYLAMPLLPLHVLYLIFALLCRFAFKVLSFGKLIPSSAVLRLQVAIVYMYVCMCVCLTSWRICISFIYFFGKLCAHLSSSANSCVGVSVSVRAFIDVSVWLAWVEIG